MKWLIGFILLVIFALHSSAEAQTDTVQISGVVYADMNENGLRDDTELGLGGLPLELYDEAGETLLETTTADIHGNFAFTIPAGKYRVKFSNGSEDTGLTNVIDVSNGQDALGILIGIAPEGFGQPTAVTQVDSQTGLSTERLIVGSSMLLLLILGLVAGKRRGLI